MASALEELLRYDSPVQMTTRTGTQDIEVGATRIPKGASIMLSMGGANHDPDVFLEPGRLPIDRTDASRHGAFGFGLHHCLGAALSRLEARFVFREVT